LVAATFSSADLEHVRRAIGLLNTPLDFAPVNSWRSSVNRCLRDLLNADTAGFILPGTDGPLVYSDEHDPRELSRYPELLPPPTPSGRSVFARVIELGVATLEEAYESDPQRYLRSTYYNDYAGRNGAHDTLSGLISLGGVDPRSVAGLQFWHSSPRGARFGPRETALFRLVFPAVRSGIEALRRWGQHRADLLSTLDALGHATLVCDARGRPLHQTPSLTDLLNPDPEQDRVRQVLLEVAVRLGSIASTPADASSTPTTPAPSSVRTLYAAYRVHGTLYRSPFSDSAALVLVALERTSAVFRTEDELRTEYGLTRAEVRVAPLLATGRTSGEIADALRLSRHTVRRHAEAILSKTGAKGRAELAVKLLR
jgi:DNA-binding CsgD family transcriptional regulator